MYSVHLVKVQPIIRDLGPGVQYKLASDSIKIEIRLRDGTD